MVVVVAVAALVAAVAVAALVAAVAGAEARPRPLRQWQAMVAAARAVAADGGPTRRLPRAAGSPCPSATEGAVAAVEAPAALAAAAASAGAP